MSSPQVLKFGYRVVVQEEPIYPPGSRPLRPCVWESGFILEKQVDLSFVTFDDERIQPRWIRDSCLRRKIGRPTGTANPPPPTAMPFNRCLGEVIRAKMEEQELTWDLLAQRSGVARASIARMLRAGGDGMRIETIEQLARALGVSPSSFWEREQKIVQPPKRIEELKEVESEPQ